MTLRDIFIRELRYIFLIDKRRASLIFGASVAYLIIFGLLYGNHVVKNIPLVLYDEDQTVLSRSFMQSLHDSERFSIISQVASPEGMEDLLKEQDAYAGVWIPRDFAKNIHGGKSSNVLLIANGINLIIINAVTTTMQEIITDFNQKVSSGIVQKAGQLPTVSQSKTSPIVYAIRLLHNPTLSYLNFFVIGLAMAAFQQGLFLSVGAGIIGEYHNADSLAASRSWDLLLGKLCPYILLGSFSFFVTLLCANTVLGIPCKGNYSSLFLLSLSFATTAIGFSSLVAAFCNNELTFTRLSLAYSVPAFTLSGYLWPLQAMDPFSHIIAYCFPLFYFSDAVRDILLVGHSPSLLENAALLASFGIILCVTATRVYSHRLQALSRNQAAKAEKALDF